MRVVHGYRDVPAGARGAALAIGNFDGVHRGHRALLARAVETGRERGGPSGALVFEPHPRVFFKPDEPHFELTPLRMKLRLFGELGLDMTAVVPFDAALAGQSAREFVERVLVAGFAISHAVVGYDFYFGKGRGGSPETMREAGGELGFGVTVVAPVAEDGEAFSSSAIRLDLARGDVGGAAQKLGRPWRVAGCVTGGARRGGGLGFPTANIVLPKETALAHGIYAARVHAGAGRYDGAAYFGARPTFDDGAPALEVFLFDFDGDLYGQEIEVDFIAFIRGDRRFATAGALAARMEEDCARAREILKSSA